MILKNDDLFVTIDDTIFRAKQDMKPQFVFDPDALQGFYDGVNVKRSETVRPNQWGDFKEPGLLASRHMGMTGAAIANTPEELHWMRDKFTSLLSDGQYREIAVQNASDTRYITVALEGSPSWVQKGDTVAVWKLDLYAPNPRMYGRVKSTQIVDGTSTGGMDYPIDYPLNYGGPLVAPAISIYNYGNTQAWPIFKVTGNYYAGFMIHDGLNSYITYDGMVTTQAPVTIDTFEGTASQGGVDRSTQLSRRDWFAIPPNGSIAPRFIPIQDGLGWCDIMYRDTWI